MELIDVFRLVIGRDPPVDMPPMEVTLKPGAVPARCRVRRYSPTHRPGGRKKTKVRSVPLCNVGWSAEEVACLELCKAALQNAVQLAHPDPDKRLCVFTDARDEHWGAVITQIPPEHSVRPQNEQEYQPFMMLGGSFSGSAKRWAIVEKEAYAIIETCRRADYLLHRPDGFALFTDHRNLRYIFDPHSVSGAVPKYEIHDIAGDDNVWADLLSRWGSSFKTVCAIRHVPLPLSPQLDVAFVWPTGKEISEAQGAGTPPANVILCDSGSLWKDEQGRIWIPDEATTQQVRVYMDRAIEFFVQRCLHYASTLGGPPQPRLLGEAMHAERPNELNHWGYLYLGKSDTNQEYVLVIKDDASKFVWLLPSEAADTEMRYNALIDWFASFGVCRTWVSDQGTHIKNKVVEALQYALGAHNHFTTARCPWANETVVVVMKETLRCCQALLSERRMQPREWTRVITIVQMALNNAPSPSLGGIQVKQREHFVRLQTAIEDMHKRTSEVNASARAAGRKAHDKKTTHDNGVVRYWGLCIIFETQNLVTGQRKEAHASRLKFYADDSLDVNEELLLHVTHNSEEHVVDTLLKARYNPNAKRHEIKVHWRGLDAVEDSWEPTDVLLQDVPAAVKAFVRSHNKQQPVKALRKALQLK
ncbi:hypothetical protein PPTG_21866 [Phytophthora nicotianae INRA-310]|uniref:Chromo domain-containing protein n=1 Tax=Phytophthora nicotianae (strain INRA-310) TaxID=761204 RepID=W2QSL0_PHYN3|nr:hypothetical protein PPTG_21866 [Phytophthora nicotianae INRA-310]ETN16098.1 hypothetical protein PPTG_21866 [Phytophthora nicotianae INRA-310]